MTDCELFSTYAGFQRDEHGTPKIEMDIGDSLPMPTHEWLYRRFLLLNGIGPGAQQDQMWEAEKVKRVQAEAKN